MDSYTLINKMRKARRYYAICAGSQGLFQELVAICNEERWPGVFKCKNGELCVALGIEEKTLIKYRDELAAAELLVYVSGKSKRCPCDYSLDGSLDGLPNGCSNGGKIYSQPDSPLVGKSTDNKNKHKTETQTKTIDEVVVETREEKFNEAVDEYFSDRDQPNRKKEKCSAQKEKPYPSINEAVIGVSSTAMWRNVLEHNSIDEDGRQALFKIFYEQKEDEYRIPGKYPTFPNMAKNFYYWIDTRNRIRSLQETPTNGNTKYQPSTNKNRSAANEERGAVASKSIEFLQKFTGTDT